MDRYEVTDGAMVPVSDNGSRKWVFAGDTETRSYERLADALIDFVETGNWLQDRFLQGFVEACAKNRKSIEKRGFGVAVRRIECRYGDDGTLRVASAKVLHERRYTVDEWRHDLSEQHARE